MNCANHPETPAVSFCQYCGKPLCAECVHKVDNVISCEPCLAARVHAATTGTAYTGGPLPPGVMATPPGWGTEPGIALAVGWIPGVGAVYNGQIAKALVHVAVFAILIDLTHYNGLIGLLIPIWILYQMVDAYRTAVARRDGLPLPNPLGLNDVGQWFGARSAGPHSGVHPGNVPPETGEPVPPAAAPPQGMAGNAPTSGFAAGFAPPYVPPQYVPPQYGAPPYGGPVPPAPPIPPNASGFWCAGGRSFPTGAIVLIVLGVLFLLGNFGVLSAHWFDRGWPILLIILGVVVVIRHTNNPPRGGVR